MSAKVCEFCDEQIVFGKDVDSGKLIPLDNLLAVYEIVEGEKVRFVAGGYRARHRCLQKQNPPEIPWSANE